MIYLPHPILNVFFLINCNNLCNFSRGPTKPYSWTGWDKRRKRGTQSSTCSLGAANNQTTRGVSYGIDTSLEEFPHNL